MKNPDWTRDELILLLDVYFRVDVKRVSRRTPEVVQLSKLLKGLRSGVIQRGLARLDVRAR